MGVIEGEKEKPRRWGERLERRALALRAMLECPGCSGKPAEEFEKMLEDLKERAMEEGRKDIQGELAELEEKVEELKELQRLKEKRRKS